MRLLAISDLHLGHSANRDALLDMPEHPDDWLIVAGDTGEKLEHLQLALDTLAPRFARIIWAPGNHDLWVTPGDDIGLRGEERYLRLVELCRSYDVLTPEDAFAVWPGNGNGTPTVIAPLLVLYDYSFRPDEVPVQHAVEWALRGGVRSADERYLHADPYDGAPQWCDARIDYSERRLAEIPAGHDTVLINHFPLRQEHARLPRIPSFMVWCGTRRTKDWHRRFAARVVVTGHLHIRTTRFLEGTRFEEVSLGYPRQWKQHRGMPSYLREILPGNDAPVGEFVWR
ncbi:MAG: metallophosphoesterase [Acidobacteriota bacterium]|jgi:predicted phosphodiesterase